MKATWLQAAAGAAALVASVGSANAATYEIDFTTGPFAPVLLTEATIDLDIGTGSVSAFTAAGYSGATLVGSTISGGLLGVGLNYASSLYSVWFSLTAPGTTGTWGLFTGLSPSLGSLLSYGSYTYDEAVVLAPVPLPATMPLLAAAMGAAGLLVRRRKDAA